MSTRLRHIIFLLVFGVVLFSPSFFNGFAYDDIAQIVKNPIVHDIGQVFSPFSSGIKAPEMSDHPVTFFYRPLLFSLYTVLFFIGNGSALPFHIFQTGIFLATIVLIYIFFSRFFSRHVAFVLSLAFLVHPINQSIATYASDLHDGLVLFFGMTALVLFGKNTSVFIKAVISGVLIFLSLLCKEWGILFVPTIFWYQRVFQKIRSYLFIVFSTVFLALYLFLRNNAYQNTPFLNYLSTYTPFDSLQERFFVCARSPFLFSERILNAAGWSPIG